MVGLEPEVSRNSISHPFFKREPMFLNVKKVVATLPIGFGFYPSQQVSSIQAFLGVSGIWRNEQEKELVALHGTVNLKQWDTELIRTRWVGLRYMKFNYGPVKGKCCKDASRSDVLSCLEDYVDKNPHPIYRLPFLHCRSRAKDALNACCLRKGKQIETKLGKIEYLWN